MNEALQPAEVRGIALTDDQAYKATQVLSTLAIEEIYPTPNAKRRLTMMAAGKLTPEEVLKELGRRYKS